MTREEFEKYYKNELKSFESNLVNEKARIKTVLHDKFRKFGYDEAITIRDQEKKKV